MVQEEPSAAVNSWPGVLQEEPCAAKFKAWSALRRICATKYMVVN